MKSKSICTNSNCKYTWTTRTKSPKSCPRCHQYLNEWKQTKPCKQCGKGFSKSTKDTDKYWRNGKRFCSLKCKGLAAIGIPNLANRGNRNGQWKGKDVSYGALHDYIKYHLPKPDRCEDCGEKKNLDLANKSQEYKRDLSDWEWLCRKCHMQKDGRAAKLRFTGRKHTPEWRQMISALHKGKPKTPEHKQKIKEALLKHHRNYLRVTAKAYDKRK